MKPSARLWRGGGTEFADVLAVEYDMNAVEFVDGFVGLDPLEVFDPHLPAIHYSLHRREIREL